VAQLLFLALTSLLSRASSLQLFLEWYQPIASDRRRAKFSRTDSLGNSWADLWQDLFPLKALSERRWVVM
jgi:hypothetical protein